MKSGTAESCGSHKCCLQQGRCVRTIDSKGTTQHNVVGFAQPTAEDIEVHALADHEELAEMMRGP